jgi:hypothetical protein
MGGTLDVRSEPGKGSVFAVEIELGAVPDTAPVAAGIPSAAVAGLKVDATVATELYDLAMKGDVNELLARLDSASNGDAAGAPLYDEVRRLARKFDMRGVRRVLQQVSENGR